MALERELGGSLVARLYVLRGKDEKEDESEEALAHVYISMLLA